MQTITKLFIFVSTIILLASCGKTYVFDQSAEIDKKGWSYGDSINYEIDIADTTAIYNLYLDIAHTTEYSHQNIYLQISTQFPNGKRIKEKLSIDMAHKTGRWNGDCNSSGCLLRVNLQEGAFFNALGKHIITIEQFMRINPLAAIKQVSLRLEDTGNRR